MPKYLIHETNTITYSIVVEAEDEQAAADLAFQLDREYDWETVSLDNSTWDIEEMKEEV